MAAATEAKSTAISAAAIREVVADVVGLNDAAVGAVDDAIEDMLVGFDEVAALMERVTERRIELSRTTLARVEALSAALPAALQAVAAAEECVAAASSSIDGYTARLSHLEVAWGARTGEKPAQAGGASAVLSGLFNFRRPGAAAPPASAASALVERPPPPQAWDAASCRLPTSSLLSKLGRAGMRVRQAVSDADAIGEGHEATPEAEAGAGAPVGEPAGAAAAETASADAAALAGEEAACAEERDGTDAVEAKVEDAAAPEEEGEEEEAGGGDSSLPLQAKEEEEEEEEEEAEASAVEAAATDDGEGVVDA